MTHTLKWSHSQSETNTDAHTHTHTRANNKLTRLGSGRTKSRCRCQYDSTYSTNTPSLVSGLYLAMLLAHVALTTSLYRVKECLYLGIDEEEEHGCQMMQQEKHKVHDIYICTYSKWDGHPGITHFLAERI